MIIVKKNGAVVLQTDKSAIVDKYLKEQRSLRETELKQLTGCKKLYTKRTWLDHYGLKRESYIKHFETPANLEPMVFEIINTKTDPLF